MAEMRLQKYLALCGIASRRRAEVLIAEGRVKVDGVVVSTPGYKVTSDSRVMFDGRPICPNKEQYYLMLNKPTGYITSSEDQFGRRTVLDLVKGVNARLYPVGRLDYDTSGLLFLTNDGDFAYRLTHPSFRIPKEYIAKVAGIPDQSVIEKLMQGIPLGERNTVALQAGIEAVSKGHGTTGPYAILNITVCEGRYRIVRRMLDEVGHPVLELKRIRIGDIHMSGLEQGEWRELDPDEIHSFDAFGGY